MLRLGLLSNVHVSISISLGPDVETDKLGYTDFMSMFNLHVVNSSCVILAVFKKLACNQINVVMSTSELLNLPYFQRKLTPCLTKCVALPCTQQVIGL